MGAMAAGSPHADAFSPGIHVVRGVPELVSVGYDEWTPRRPHELDHHVHDDCWEIHYLVHGQIVEEVAGTAHLMGGGDVLIAPPGVVHTGINRVRHRCGLCWIGLRLDPRKQLAGFTREAMMPLRRAFSRLGGKPFAGDPALRTAFAGLLREAALPGSTQALLCRSYLHLILALMSRASGGGAGGAAPRSPQIAAAVALLSENLGFPLRIATLSDKVGLGRSALTERFVGEMGLTPVEFRMQRRLDEAKRLLPVTSTAEVARQLGFSTTQYLATRFRRAFGITPSAWRRSHAATTPRSG
jgi:AraC-like DNA-binding protein